MNKIASNGLSLSSEATGLTLVELLISITVIAILALMTLPSFKNTVMNNRVSAQTDAFFNALSYARNTALSQNTTVSVCPASAQGSASCGTNWQTGWIVIRQPAGGAAVLLQAYFSGENDPVLSPVAVAGATPMVVTFDPRGIATTQANFKSCDSRGGSFARSIEVLPTGFIQSSDTMGTAVWNGGALTCP